MKIRRKEKTIEQIERRMKFEIILLMILFIVWMGFTFLTISYSYALDPILSMNTWCFFFGVYLVLWFMTFFYRKLFIEIRKFREDTEVEEYE